MDTLSHLLWVFFSITIGLIFGVQMFFTVLIAWGIHVILHVFSHEGFWATKIYILLAIKAMILCPGIIINGSM